MNNYNETIPICFATDEGYLGFTTVAIQSLVDNSSKENFYDIHIFHSKISKSEQDKVTNHFSNIENVNVVFDDVKEFVKNNSLYTDYEFDYIQYTEETYYRFLIPEIMKQYDKVVYLDGDTITLTDIKELYDTDLGDNLLGAARDLYGISDCLTTLRGRYMKKKLKVNNLNDIFIAGILIFNNREFNKKYSWEELLSICSSYNWRHHDQDVLNMICNGRTKLFSTEWGIMPLYHYPFLNLPEEIKNDFQSSYRKEKKLIHYGGSRKPWNKGFSFKAKEFWIYASKTPYYNDLLSKCIEPEIRWLALTSVFGKNISIENGSIKINQIKIFDLKDSKITIYDIKKIDDELLINGYVYTPWIKENDNVEIMVETNNKEVKCKSLIDSKNTINNDYYEKTMMFSFSVPIDSKEKYSITLKYNDSKAYCQIINKNKWIKNNRKILYLINENNTITIETISKTKHRQRNIEKMGCGLFQFIKINIRPSNLLKNFYYATFMISRGKIKELFTIFIDRLKK